MNKGTVVFILIPSPHRHYLWQNHQAHDQLDTTVSVTEYLFSTFHPFSIFIFSFHLQFHCPISTAGWEVAILKQTISHPSFSVDGTKGLLRWMQPALIAAKFRTTDMALVLQRRGWWIAPPAIYSAIHLCRKTMVKAGDGGAGVSRDAHKSQKWRQPRKGIGLQSVLWGLLWMRGILFTLVQTLCRSFRVKKIAYL